MFGSRTCCSLNDKKSMWLQSCWKKDRRWHCWFRKDLLEDWTQQQKKDHLTEGEHFSKMQLVSAHQAQDIDASLCRISLGAVSAVLTHVWTRSKFCFIPFLKWCFGLANVVTHHSVLHATNCNAATQLFQSNTPASLRCQGTKNLHANLFLFMGQHFWKNTVRLVNLWCDMDVFCWLSWNLASNSWWCSWMEGNTVLNNQHRSRF